MGRNRSVVTASAPGGAAATEITEEVLKSIGKALEPLAFAKVVQMGIGVDLLGAAMSLSTRQGNKLAITAIGVVAHSKKTGRCVLVPWANVRGCELERIQPKVVEPTKPTEPVKAA